MTNLTEDLPQYLISYAATDGTDTIHGQFNSNGLIGVSDEIMAAMVEDIPMEHTGGLHDLINDEVENVLDNFLIKLGEDSPNRSTFKHYVGDAKLVVVVDRLL